MPSPSALKPVPVLAVQQEPRGIAARIDAEDRKRLNDIFDQMDSDHDGHVSTSEFTRYLSRNPRGWPLADLLHGQSDQIRAQMIMFWFRKLDCQSEGYFNKEELAAFFAALKVTEFRENFTADFLLNLFDIDLDGRLSRVEVKRMLRVMLGHEPSEETVEHLCGRSHFISRAELVSMLHEVEGDVGRIESTTAARIGKNTLVDLVAVASVVGVIAACAALLLRFNASKK